MSSHQGAATAAEHVPVPPRAPAERAATTRQTNAGRQLSLILEKGAREVGAVAMNPTIFVQAMLPHREVYLRDGAGQAIEVKGPNGTERLLATSYTARNGEFRMTVRAGMRPGPTHLHAEVSRGIPNGGLARLLLCHIITAARKQDSQVIDLGATLTEFCTSVNITPSGGEHGRLRYVLDQLQRLATCAVSYEWETITPGRRDLRGEQLFVVDSYHFWHRGASASTEAVDGGSIRLSDKFWTEIVSSCFPLDFRKAQLLRGNPTAYDLYLWLTYRLSALQRRGSSHVAVNYDDLHGQLGSHYQTDEYGVLTPAGKKNFGYRVRGAMKTIGAMWPELRYDTPRGRLILHNSGPDVEYRSPKKRT